MNLGCWTALSPLRHVKYLIYHAAPDKEIWTKKIQSSQTEWPDKADYKTGLKEAGAVRSGDWWSSQSIQSRPGYQRSLEKDLPLGQTDA